MSGQTCNQAPKALTSYGDYVPETGNSSKLSTNYQLGTKQFYTTNKKDETMPYIVWNDSGNSTVNFGDTEYVCESMKLFTPSIHTWNSTQAHGELVIEHYSSDNSNVKLIICVPFNLIQDPNFESKLDGLISTSTTAKSSNIKDISFGHYIPKGKGFAMYDADASYNSSCPIDSNGLTYKYIVFELDQNSDLHINSTTDVIDDMPDQNTISTKDNNSIPLVNPKGATFANSDIYIKCQPTGNIDEDVMITAPLPSKKSKISILNQYLYYFISLVGTAVLLYLVILFIQSVIGKFGKGATTSTDGNGQ